MKNNNGFTLIELLAVIVILAIVTVVATRSILPYMSNSRIDAFGIEATEIVKSASSAVDLYNLNQLKMNGTNSCVKDNVFCFTVEELIDLGLYTGTKDTYKGKVLVNMTDTFTPTYEVYIQKGAEFSINGSTDTDYVNKKDNIDTGGFANDKVDEYTKCTCS